MNIHIMQDFTKDQDWIVIHGDYEQFHIWGDNEDYVEDTVVLLQKAATSCFKFPFYIHFEGYEDDAKSVLLMRDQFEIHYQPSGRTVLTMFNGKTYHAEIPAFTITIPNSEVLKKVFTEWFYLAQQNSMWLITQGKNVYYKNKIASIEMSKEPTMLLADHDAQGLCIITNQSSYQSREGLRLIFEKI
ncbi:hypothetical protein [Bacillus sp. FJAT-45066]|uniref:hypothetical protein n=1 Tax=Bacillus sp. FJAT-45066 TaxID=2011010 RepID=UPI000BB68A4C|nr:hypothetical protein [Bacillus sp. FJAT-45066]